MKQLSWRVLCRTRSLPSSVVAIWPVAAENLPIGPDSYAFPLPRLRTDNAHRL
jgi:hypothetical protein